MPGMGSRVCAVALACLVGLAGCSGTSDSKADSSKQDSPAEEVVETPEADSADEREIPEEKDVADEKDEVEQEDTQVEATKDEKSADEAAKEDDLAEKTDGTVKLSDATVTVPKDWTIEKDLRPEQLIISNDEARIEFWCGASQAEKILNSGQKLDEWVINNISYRGFSRSSVDYELVTGTLCISSSEMYWTDLSRFLEANIKI